MVTPIPKIGGELRIYHGIAQPFADHSHNHYVIGLVEKGERELSLNGDRIRIAPNDLIVFNPGDVHGCCQASDEPFAYTSITIAPDVLEGAHLQFPSSEKAEALQRFCVLLRSIERKDNERIIDKTLDLASCLDSVETYPAKRCIHEESAMRVYAHLCCHLAEPRTIAELAVSEGITEYALIRAYKRKFRITPIQHLMSLRIECACTLLSRGSSPADVAAETGFADQAHFTRIFKQRIGTTPGAYKKMIRSNIRE